MVESTKKKPRHRGPIFEATKRKALIVGCRYYDKLREKPAEEAFNYSKFGDLETTDEDVVWVRAGLLRIGFTEEEITTLPGPTFKEFQMAFLGLLKTIKGNYDENEEKTLVFIYYAGHGVSDNYTFAMLNDPTRPQFPLEQQVRTLSKQAGSYVVALFDCCRERVKVPKAMSSAAHGGADENFIITFGCPPTATVPARSTIARAYFTFLRDAADDEGAILLPGNLNYWNGDDGKCEHSLKVPGGAIEL